MNDLRRRRFLFGAATVVGAAAGLVVTGGSEADARPRSSDALVGDADATVERVVPFYGPHQAGILDPPARSTATVALDLTCDTRAELVEMMRTLTERARFLTGGGTPANMGISAPSPDSGTLGPVVPAGGLTVTVGLGAGAFDDRYGLSADRPSRLRAMDTFPNDNLDRALCDGDLLLQLGADEADTVLHALRDLTRNTRGAMQIRWRIDGFTPRSRPTGAPRNLLGFKDGTANPDVTDSALMEDLVWVQAGTGEPAWAAGGTYHVVRIIRMLVEFWDRVSIGEQERMIGRRKDSGAPLSGSAEADPPDYGNDPLGAAIPLDAHIRRANPRTAADRSEPDPPSRVQLRPRDRSGRQPRSGFGYSPASSRTSIGSSSRRSDGWPTSRWSTTSPRSAAATSSPFPGFPGRVTTMRGRCSGEPATPIRRRCARDHEGKTDAALGHRPGGPWWWPRSWLRWWRWARRPAPPPPPPVRPRPIPRHPVRHPVPRRRVRRR